MQPTLPPFKIGTGYDIHRLVEGRPLILCGVPIDYSMGLDGHSDADVALHAICDALLGCIGSRDIGYHFPPSDNTYKNCDSALLLKRVMDMVKEAGYTVGNIDVVIIAEAPKLSPYIEQMQQRVGELVETPFVSVKATTHEKLGTIGRGEGIAAQAVALVYRK